MATAPGASSTDFVDRFTAAWNDPGVERLNALLHEDVELIQPLQPTVRGIPAVTRTWERVFGLMPDLRGDVLSSATEGDDVFIELKLGGTVAGTRIEWVTLDRIKLRDGLVLQRIAYFDSGVLMRQLALHPRAMAAFARAQLSRR